MEVKYILFICFVISVGCVDGFEHFIFGFSEAINVPIGKLLIMGYVDMIHSTNELSLNELFNSETFLNSIGKLLLLPDISVFVIPRYISCQRHYLETSVIEIMAAVAIFKNMSAHGTARTSLIVHNCDLSCSVFSQIGRFAADMEVYLTLCNKVVIEERAIFHTVIDSENQGTSNRIIIRETVHSFEPAVTQLISLLKHGLGFLNLNCINIVTVPDTIYIEEQRQNKSLEEILKSRFECNSTELFDLRNNLYVSRVAKSQNYFRGPTFYYILMNALDALEYHKYAIDLKFTKEKIPLLLTYNFNPNDNSTYSAFNKLDRAFFFNLKDASPILANFNSDSSSGRQILSPIYFYDRVIAAFRDLVLNVHQITESIINDSLYSNFEGIDDTEGFAELWLLWDMTKNPRSYSFGRFYFGNKSTVKNIPDAHVKKLFEVANLTNLKSVNDCGMHGVNCKLHDFGNKEMFSLAIGPTTMLALFISGYLLYRLIHYKLLQRSVIQWKIAFYDEVKRSVDFRKHTSLVISALRKKSKTSAAADTLSPDVSSPTLRTVKKNKSNSGKSSAPNQNLSAGNKKIQSSDNENWNSKLFPSFLSSKFIKRKSRELIKNRVSSGEYCIELGRKSSLFEKHQSHQNLAVFQEDEVYLSRMSAGKLWENMFYTNILEELVQMKNINHENLLPFLGVSMKYGTVLMLAARRGSLRDIIKDKCLNQVFNLEIMVSVLLDIAKGMDYLHNSVIGSHGSLRSSKCVLDNRWNCKITGYGLKSIRQYKSKKQGPVYQNYLYYSPEFLRTPVHYRSFYGTRKGDVYAFGIILQEVIHMADPYVLEIKNKNMEIPQILVLVRSRKQHPPFRPNLGENCRLEWKMLAEACWHEIPEYRFSFQQIMTILRKLAGIENFTFVERLAQRLEQNVSNLGNMVSELTADVQKESEKTNAFLSSLLPKVVAQDYILGKQYKPEIFQSVTMLCTDIIGFTKISGISTPRQTVALLRDLYTGFDTALSGKDAYKLETIGDAYIVISGCPERNGNRHASEVSEVALEIVNWVKTFEIPHLPNWRIEIRAGIHSGPVIAGVVGLKVPRFCVFGKTYSTAELLEGSCAENKILISKVSVDLLPKNQYVLQHRGKIELPDRETLETYFLESKRR